MTFRLDLTPKLLKDPKHWHRWAQEARIRAEQISDPKARRLMIGVAESYERLAAKAEERLRKEAGQADRHR